MITQNATLQPHIGSPVPTVLGPLLPSGCLSIQLRVDRRYSFQFTSDQRRFLVWFFLFLCIGVLREFRFASAESDCVLSSATFGDKRTVHG